MICANLRNEVEKSFVEAPVRLHIQPIRGRGFVKQMKSTEKHN